MPTFKFHKRTDEVEEPTLLPVDWYPVTVIEDPVITPNTALKDMVEDLEVEREVQEALATNEKAGYNMVIQLEVESDEPSYAGRRLRFWLPYPTEHDLDRYDSRGMIVYDAKLQRIADFAEKFRGMTEGDEIDISAGLQGRVYIEQRRSQNREGLENAVSMFAGFKYYEEFFEGGSTTRYDDSEEYDGEIDEG